VVAVVVDDELVVLLGVALTDVEHGAVVGAGLELVCAGLGRDEEAAEADGVAVVLLEAGDLRVKLAVVVVPDGTAVLDVRHDRDLAAPVLKVAVAGRLEALAVPLVDVDVQTAVRARLSLRLGADHLLGQALVRTAGHLDRDLQTGAATVLVEDDVDRGPADGEVGVSLAAA
jgi:hypothetical protein